MNRRDALKALMAMPAVTAIAVARVAPDDVIILEHPGMLSREAIARIQASMTRVWPGRQVVVLEEGMRMRIARGDTVTH